MSNNDIMKKLRVAMKFTDDDIIKVLELVNFRITKTEIGAIFRADDHPNFKPCGDQILRNFLNGLIIYTRGPRDGSSNTGQGIPKFESEDKAIDRGKAKGKTE